MKHPANFLSRQNSKWHLLLTGLLLYPITVSCSSEEDGPGNGQGSGADGNGAGGSGADGSTTGGSTASGSSSATTGGSSTAAGGTSSDGGSGSGGDGETGTGSSSSNGASCGLANQSQSGADELQALIDELEASSCEAESREAEPVPADIFIMLDQSTSMSNPVDASDPDSLSRWEALTEGLKHFIESDDARGLRIGIQYFGLPGSDDDGQSCNADDYGTPDVPIDALPDNADALIESIDSHFPSNLTPSIPALEGALAYAKEWASGDGAGGRPTVVVFATDGFPTQCEPRGVADLEEIADRYANPTDGSAPITTYVVGVGKVANLQRVAEAGGSGDAFFVDDCPTAVEDLTTALGRVASSSALCDFAIPEPPEGQFLDPNQVTLVFSPDGSPPEFISRVQTQDGCGNGGWYYDDAEDPERILVCSETCNRFGRGTLDLFVGCEPPDIQ